uniref:RING finger protein nhl-1-like n=2 Tax=Callorhinchus milii TaxID=7868 RepID=A0A4W3H667_CALMI
MFPATRFIANLEMNHHLIEQLLTCPVCLDRYKRPKLLPCQHTFCQEPCLKGLVNEVNRKVKCPECRAVHKIPREGVSGFPNNRTILSFLEIPLEQIPGLNSNGPLTCHFCSLKEELAVCCHCEKHLCDSCQHLHMEQLRLDLKRLVSQLRRSVPKLSNALGALEQKLASLKQNVEAVRAEIRRSVERFIAELKEREQVLMLEAETLVQSAVRTLQLKQENLELELASISSHCDCVENSLKGSGRLPSSELWQLHKQSRELIGQIRYLDEPDEVQPKVLRFTANTVALHTDVVKFGSVSWATKNSTPLQLLSSSLSRYQATQNSHRSITVSTQSSIEMYSPLTINNSLNPLPRMASNYLSSNSQLGQRASSSDSQALIIELLDMNHHMLSLPLTGRDLQLHYQEKGRLQFKFGSKGSDLGHFTWPRGVAVSPEGHVVVADSSNHRVQIFSGGGRFVRAFGSYGSSDGEFDCLAGVAVNSQGWIIIADRYNHRIQIFDRVGRFIRKFGKEGACNGQLSYPWGVTTDGLGFIYVCDKDNHRVQVFTLDGQFVRRFGRLGSGDGQLEHPHYLTITSQNQVVVSDSCNHRVQVFDKYGRFVSKFGSEGTAPGQFKYPRGLAVDHEGNILVGDSGNNRIQIFRPDGTFLQAFGSWGTGDGQVKGLEGIAFYGGDIIISDRENHRIQIF